MGAPLIPHAPPDIRAFLRWYGKEHLSIGDCRPAYKEEQKFFDGKAFTGPCGPKYPPIF
jgi:hypothetical protein